MAQSIITAGAGNVEGDRLLQTTNSAQLNFSDLETEIKSTIQKNILDKNRQEYFLKILDLVKSGKDKKKQNQEESLLEGKVINNYTMEPESEVIFEFKNCIIIGNMLVKAGVSDQIKNVIINFSDCILLDLSVVATNAIVNIRSSYLSEVNLISKELSAVGSFFYNRCSLNCKSLKELSGCELTEKANLCASNLDLIKMSEATSFLPKAFLDNIRKKDAKKIAVYINEHLSKFTSIKPKNNSTEILFSIAKSFYHSLVLNEAMSSGDIEYKICIVITLIQLAYLYDDKNERLNEIFQITKPSEESLQQRKILHANGLIKTRKPDTENNSCNVLLSADLFQAILLEIINLNLENDAIKTRVIK